MLTCGLCLLKEYYDQEFVKEKCIFSDVLFCFSHTVRSSSVPDFDWVSTITVSEDLTVSLYGADCGKNIPRLNINFFTKSVISPKIDRYTNGNRTVIINQAETATGAVTGTFSLLFKDNTGTEIPIQGSDTD